MFFKYLNTFILSSFFKHIKEFLQFFFFFLIAEVKIKLLHVVQWFSTASDSAPEDRWGCLETILVMATGDPATAI